MGNPNCWVSCLLLASVANHEGVLGTAEARGDPINEISRVPVGVDRLDLTDIYGDLPPLELFQLLKGKEVGPVDHQQRLRPPRNFTRPAGGLEMILKNLTLPPGSGDIESASEESATSTQLITTSNNPMTTSLRSDQVSDIVVPLLTTAKPKPPCGLPFNGVQFPWLAYLRMGKQRCAGILIDPEWVVTVAFCVATTPAHNRKEAKLGCTNCRHVNVSQIVVHPGYVDPRKRLNNIALLRLAYPQPMPVCTDKIYDPLDWDKMVSIGWRYGGLEIEQVRLRLQNDTLCRKWLKLDPFPPEMICGEPALDESGTMCRWDYGAFFGTTNEMGAYEVMGFNSHRHHGGCIVNRQLADGFVMLAPYESWIHSIIGKQ